jgi:hypothetical protein
MLTPHRHTTDQVYAFERSHLFHWAIACAISYSVIFAHPMVVLAVAVGAATMQLPLLMVACISVYLLLVDPLFTVLLLACAKAVCPIAAFALDQTNAFRVARREEAVATLVSAARGKVLHHR